MYKNRRPAGDLPPREPEAMRKTLKYNETKEHFVRRLGAAVVLHWDTLPDALQDLLIDQAALVKDRDEAPHGAAEIETFVRTVKTVAIAAPVAAATEA